MKKIWRIKKTLHSSIMTNWQFFLGRLATNWIFRKKPSNNKHKRQRFSLNIKCLGVRMMLPVVNLTVDRAVQIGFLKGRNHMKLVHSKRNPRNSKAVKHIWKTKGKRLWNWIRERDGKRITCTVLKQRRSRMWVR